MLGKKKKKKQPRKVEESGEFKGQAGERPLGAAPSGLSLLWTSGIALKRGLCFFVALQFLKLKLTQLQRVLNLPRERENEQ